MNCGVFKKCCFILIILCSALLFSTSNVSAHEAYVLPQNNFWSSIHGNDNLEIFNALKSHSGLNIAIAVTICLTILLTLNFFFRRSQIAQGLEKKIEKLSPLGPIFVRIAVAISLIMSALTMSFLGTEVRLTDFPMAHVLQIALLVSGIMIGLGFLTEIGAIIGLVVFTLGFLVYGLYMMTYINYLGEFIVLLIFGMRIWSVDKYLFGPLRRFTLFEKYETTIVRVAYGLALIFAAVTIKLIHPSLTVDVVNDYNLTQFHWLFPDDPLLIVLGAFLAETVIGLFMIIGFEMRLTIIITLFYLTLSIIFFQEKVWPHLILYGISLSLFVQPENFTLDHLLFEKHQKTKKWWHRPLSPYVKKKEIEKI